MLTVGQLTDRAKILRRGRHPDSPNILSPSLLPILLLGFFFISGCIGSSHRTHPAGFDETLRGLASWYGPSFHGKPTASGEIFNMWALTAAHRTFPFGTTLLVRSVETGKSVGVRINDRGPFIDGRIIDLSYGAARELEMIGKGTDEVILAVVDNPIQKDASDRALHDRFWVQAGSFKTLTDAVTLRERLSRYYPGLRVQTVNLPSGEWHRVQIGGFASEHKARRVANELEDRFQIEPLLLQDN